MKIVYLKPFDTASNTVCGIVHEPGTSLALIRGDRQFRPTQIHLLPDGAKGDKPSLAVVGFDVQDTTIVGQMSLEMLDKAIKEMGYVLAQPEIFEKANKWDTLADEIEKEYGEEDPVSGEWVEYPDDDEQHDLCTIGEKAARAFGWLN